MRKLKTGDPVVVLAGKDKGKKGKILKVFPSKERVLVSGVNLVKKHIKPSQSEPGKISSIESPIHISNIAYFIQEDNDYGRVSMSVDDNGKKVRFLKKLNKII